MNFTGTLIEPVRLPTGRASATHIAALSKPAAGDGASKTLQSLNLPSAALHSSITEAAVFVFANLLAQAANCSAKLPADAPAVKAMAVAAATKAALIDLTGNTPFGFLPVMVPVPFPGPGGSSATALNGDLLKKGSTVAASHLVNKTKRIAAAFEQSTAKLTPLRL